MAIRQAREHVEPKRNQSLKAGLLATRNSDHAACNSLSLASLTLATVEQWLRNFHLSRANPGREGTRPPNCEHAIVTSGWPGVGSPSPRSALFRLGYVDQGQAWPRLERRPKRRMTERDATITENVALHFALEFRSRTRLERIDQFHGHTRPLGERSSLSAIPLRLGSHANVVALTRRGFLVKSKVECRLRSLSFG